MNPDCDHGVPTKRLRTQSSSESQDPRLFKKRPSIHYATVVIFLEFFAWGLLTTPMISILNTSFPKRTLLMNGLITGIKGFLSFLSAPLIGALSDVYGRRPFLLLTVFCTCLPIPWMILSHWWYFVLLAISGLFSVTFSVVFAYVADITEENERSMAYGQISATFAASLVISPAIGAYLSSQFGDTWVILLATTVASVDLAFIYLCVPESLAESMQAASKLPISWEKADPFASLRSVGKDRGLLMISLMVFLSYIAEAGQYSCLFVYLSRVIGFSRQQVALYIAVLGVLSVLAQTVVLCNLMKMMGHKSCIVIGLIFQILQLAWYGIAQTFWMLWSAGCLAALATITYPAMSSLASRAVGSDQQGVAQGIITGVRGLCMGLGPALFGVFFYLVRVNLEEEHDLHSGTLLRNNIPNIRPSDPQVSRSSTLEQLVTHPSTPLHFAVQRHKLTGAPFLAGAVFAFLSLLVTLYFSGGRRRTASLSDRQLPHTS